MEPVRRPRFYDLRTVDGVSYEQIARLHGADVLATTVLQTCIRYAEDQRCRFCSIEASLAAGSTIAVKRPDQLAEVAAAAVRLDGVRQMVMTTGTPRARPGRAAPGPVRAGSETGRARTADPGAVRAAGRPARRWPNCGTQAPTRSASTSSPSTTGCAAGGCPARPRCRCRRTGRPGRRRSGCSAATRCRPICWSASARIRTNWSRVRRN